MSRNVELSLVLVHAEGSSVQTDNITDFVSDGEVFESLGVDHNSCVIIVGGFTALGVEGGVDDLERADILVSADLVREGSIDDDTVDVVRIRCGEGNLSEFSVLVLLALYFSDGFGGGGGFACSLSWHYFWFC